MQRITLVATALMLCAASTVVGQEMMKIKPMKQAKQETKAPTLTIGDNAPAIDIAHWLKGDKIDHRVGCGMLSSRAERPPPR